MVSDSGGTARAVREFDDCTLDYSPAELLLRLHRRHGPVIRFGTGRNRTVYLLGPEANQFIAANSQLFCWREAYEALIPVDGPTSMIVSDGEDHRRRRTLVQPALHHRQIDNYLNIMTENADAVIQSWQAGRTVDVYQEFRSAIRRSTIQSLFGPRLAADADFFGEQLQSLLDLIDRLPAMVTWQRRLRLPIWRRAVAARSRIDERIYAEIDRVRDVRAEEAGDGVLAALVHGRDATGNALSDLEIRDQVVTLIAAGYETTSAALAWAVYALLSTPGTWDQAAAEVRAVLGDRPPGRTDLRQLVYLNGVVQETLRLYPPAVITARKVVQDFEFAGRQVHRGTLLIASPYVTHRLPELWPDPLRFRPERWDARRPDYRKPGPHEYLPFGAGPHRCIGAVMATTEMTVMLARMLARTSLRLPSQRIRPTSYAAMRPRRGLLVETA
ncbi:cytochrome P450 [Micromonospora sonneratiae]